MLGGSIRKVQARWCYAATVPYEMSMTSRTTFRSRRNTNTKTICDRLVAAVVCLQVGRAFTEHCVGDGGVVGNCLVGDSFPISVSLYETKTTMHVMIALFRSSKRPATITKSTFGSACASSSAQKRSPRILNPFEVPDKEVGLPSIGDYHYLNQTIIVSQNLTMESRNLSETMMPRPAFFCLLP